MKSLSLRRPRVCPTIKAIASTSTPSLWLPERKSDESASGKVSCPRRRRAGAGVHYRARLRATVHLGHDQDHTNGNRSAANTIRGAEAPRRAPGESGEPPAER